MGEKPRQGRSRRRPIGVCVHAVSVPPVSVPPAGCSLARMRRLMLVANPAASAFTQSLHGDVVRILENGYRVYAPWPESAEQATAAAHQAARIGYDVVVAMGGDGTANAVANGVFGSGTTLGIVPAGTTNVLARLLGFGVRPRKAAEAIVAADDAVRPIPTLRLDLSGPSGDATRIATFAAGIGFDAEVVSESERRPLKKIGFGAIHYARSTLSVASRFGDQLATLRVEAADGRCDAVGVLIQVHDELTYFGRRPMRLGPPPGPMALSIERVRAARMVPLAARALLRRRLDRGSGLRLWRGFDSLKVRAEPAALAEADGEVLGPVSVLTATPQDHGLVGVDTSAR
jgi:diacylglycerol kinase family enzyme